MKGHGSAGLSPKKREGTRQPGGCERRQKQAKSFQAPFNAIFCTARQAYFCIVTAATTEQRGRTTRADKIRWCAGQPSKAQRPMAIIAAMNPLPAEDRPRPESLRDLFVSFTLLALQGFGGVLAIVQRELVERKRWMTREEFIEDWAVAQIMPGPNVVNLSLMVGGRYFGLKGAMVALAGMLTVPLVIVVLLALLYAQFSSHPGVAGALRGMGTVAAGLIVATGLRLAGALQKNVLGWRLCGLLGTLCFVAIAWLRLPLAVVLLGLGSLACTLAYKRLSP